MRLEADGEVIKLRAAINGVELSETEVNDLLAKKIREASMKKASIRCVAEMFEICVWGIIVLNRERERERELRNYSLLRRYQTPSSNHNLTDRGYLRLHSSKPIYVINVSSVRAHIYLRGGGDNVLKYLPAIFPLSRN